MATDRKEIEDFLEDKRFKDWVLHPSLESDKYWAEWLRENKQSEKAFNQAKVILKSIKFAKHELDAEAKSRIFKHIQQHIKDDEPIDASVIPLWLKIAAAVIVIIGIGFFVVKNETGRQSLNGEKIVYETPAGKRSRLQLSDGTVVHLNYKSRLEFPENFGVENRQVFVSGEAYFEVAKDKQKPFIVSTALLEVEVLGTHFNVKARLNENAVALIEGSLKVLNIRNADSLMLTPGEMATYSRVDNSMSVSEFDSLYDLAWRDDKIVFRNASLDEVVERLSDWYGVEFTILNKDKSLAWSYSGTFHKESLVNILRSLSIVRHFQYEITDRKVIITFPTG